MTRTTTKTKSNRRVVPVSVILKRTFFEEVLGEVMVGVHGGYRFESTAKDSLKEAADSFLENMWTDVKQIAVENGKLQIDKSSVLEWKRRTGFQIRRKSKGISLCGLFDIIEKQHPRKYRHQYSNM